MNDSDKTNLPFHVFDPDEDVLLTNRKLPHWPQPGTLCFITFRTHDSMPKAVVQRWSEERRKWLEQHGVIVTAPDSQTSRGARRLPKADNWRIQFQRLDEALQSEFHNRFSKQWQSDLDDCHGECVLRRSELAEIVANSLRHFDQDRYNLTDFVVIPNHVHLLAAFPDPQQMLKQCESWKHFTATQINCRLKRNGRFWQQDGFDHLVRSVEQFEYLRRYIAENSTKCGLRDGEFLHESKKL